MSILLLSFRLQPDAWTADLDIVPPLPERPLHGVAFDVCSRGRCAKAHRESLTACMA
jgi:hypothetical protein